VKPRAMGAVGKVELSENHRRVLSVVLRGLDQMCGEAQDCLDNRLGRLWPERMDLTAEQQEEVRRLAGRIRREIHRIAEGIEAEGEVLSAKAVIRALASAQIVQLEESDSSGLRGYGPLSGRAAAWLDTEVGHLKTLLGEMVRVVEGGHRAKEARKR
jgi:hypothetical protein